MLKQTVDAVFENGVFRPLVKRAISIGEGQQVRLTVETIESPAQVLELVVQVYDGLTEQEIDEIEQLALNRNSWFDDRSTE